MAQNHEQLTREVKTALNQSVQGLKAQDDDVVICANCQSEFFVTGIRLAKAQQGIGQEALGLIHESPIAFCINCGERLPGTLPEIKTKKDLK